MRRRAAADKNFMIVTVSLHCRKGRGELFEMCGSVLVPSGNSDKSSRVQKVVGEEKR